MPHLSAGNGPIARICTGPILDLAGPNVWIIRFTHLLIANVTPFYFSAKKTARRSWRNVYNSTFVADRVGSHAFLGWLFARSISEKCREWSDGLRLSL